VCARAPCQGEPLDDIVCQAWLLQPDESVSLCLAPLGVVHDELPEPEHVVMAVRCGDREPYGVSGCSALNGVGTSEIDCQCRLSPLHLSSSPYGEKRKKQ
jgi:hypothetical protein